MSWAILVYHVGGQIGTLKLRPHSTEDFLCGPLIARDPGHPLAKRPHVLGNNRILEP